MTDPTHGETFVDPASGHTYRHDATTGTAELVPATSEVQTWRIEIRFDFTGTRAEADEIAGQAASRVPGDNAEVTAIFDENWNEVND